MTKLSCHCGQRIFPRDVMQHGLCTRPYGPAYVYVRFRCCRCRRLGEQFVREEEWTEQILRDAVCEVTAEERDRFDSMGPITAEEMANFHYALGQLDAIPTFSDEKKA
jgi:hypothetical protein